MRLILGALTGALACSSAYAEELVSLDSILQGTPEASYEFVRCAAFYKANVDWAGDAVPKSAVDEHKRMIIALLYVATETRRSKTNADFENEFQTVQADATAIAQLYGENYRQSYALRGAAWDGNPLWESDSATCQPSAEVAILWAEERLGRIEP